MCSMQDLCLKTDKSQFLTSTENWDLPKITNCDTLTEVNLFNKSARLYGSQRVETVGLAAWLFLFFDFQVGIIVALSTVLCKSFLLKKVFSVTYTSKPAFVARFRTTNANFLCVGGIFFSPVFTAPV